METKKHIFSVIERKLFMNILRSYKHVIENKEIDAHTRQIKNNAWEEITREYNASPHCTYQVSTKQLRRLWLNLKQRQKERLTKKREHRNAILGEEFKNRPMNSELPEFQKQLLNEQIREAKANATLLESQRRAQDQIHELQKQLLQEQIREAKVKADLIERKLLQGQDPDTEQ